MAVSTGRFRILVATTLTLVAAVLGSAPAQAATSDNGLLVATATASPASSTAGSSVEVGVDASFLGSSCDYGCPLYVGFDVATEYVGTITTGSPLNASVSLIAPDNVGIYSIVVSVSDAFGPVASVVAGTFTVATPTQQVIEATASASRVYQGGSVRIDATSYQFFSDGSSVPLDFDGDAKVQYRRPGDTWRTVGIETPYTSSVSFLVGVPASGWFRVVDASTVAVSAPVAVSVIAITGYKVGTANVSPEPRVQGAKASITAGLAVHYRDGTWRPAPSGTRFTVQFRPSGGSGWSTVARTSSSRRGVASASIVTWRTGWWRVTAGKAVGGADEVRTLPVRPSRIAVNWPSYIYTYSPFHVYADVVANNGRYWGGSVKLVLQYRSSTLQSWDDLDAGYSTRTRSASLISQWGSAGYYRVYAPSLGLTNSCSYFPSTSVTGTRSVSPGRNARQH